MKMPLPSASRGCCSEKETRDIIEQAKEELQILETQHPNGFNYLKRELKSFISSLESQNLFLSEYRLGKMLAWATDSFPVSTSSSATTQASSTCKKRKKVDSKNEETAAPNQKFQRVDRIDAVFERARACLEKIQQFKTSISR